MIPREAPSQQIITQGNDPFNFIVAEEATPHLFSSAWKAVQYVLISLGYCKDQRHVWLPKEKGKADEGISCCPAGIYALLVWTARVLHMSPRVRLKNKVNRPGPLLSSTTPEVLSASFYSEATCWHTMGLVRCTVCSVPDLQQRIPVHMPPMSETFELFTCWY